MVKMKNSITKMIFVTSLFLLWAINIYSFQDVSLVRIKLSEPSDMTILVKMGIDIARFKAPGEVEAWVTEVEFEKISTEGFDIEYIPDLAKIYADSLEKATRNTSNPMDDYHNYDELTTFLNNTVDDHPNICQLISIGTSVQGRELWFMKITDNPTVEESEPEFKYIANMHGNEPVGRELCLYLIDWLTDNYGTNTRATYLVDNAEIWIMPSMNPDGFELHQRYNVQGVDLNRDFPDRISDPNNTTDGRAPETQAVMNWAFQHSHILSANFHTGALVTNYPYDSNESGNNVYTACPDDALFIDVSLSYSIHNSPMYNSPYFDQGITNGADWYVIYGGMQDWNYEWQGDFEVTIEQSNTFWPPASQLPSYWADNQESMISYIESMFRGIKGIVTDASTGLPVAASIEIVGIDHKVYTDPDVGDYYRMVMPGTYDLLVETDGYEPQIIENVIVNEQEQTIVDIQFGITCIPGDVNNDGEINIADIVKIVQFILILDIPDDYEFCAADWNFDGVINVQDIVGIVQYILNQ